MKDYQAVVIGVSAGGLNALMRIFSQLPDRFTLPIIVVQHTHPAEDGSMYKIFQASKLKIKEAFDKQVIQSGNIYFGPPEYHLLIEQTNTIALSVDDRVNFSRPSIDVLFESAAYVWKDRLIAILLTGASMDGARGMLLIKSFGGLTIVQDPQTAEFPFMPQSARSSSTGMMLPSE